MRRILVCFTGLIVFLGACSTSPVDDQNVVKDSPSRSTSHDTVSVNPARAVTGHTGNFPTSDGLSTGHPVPDNSYADIWKRLGQGLVIQRDLSKTITQQKLAFYARKQEYLNRVADRAAPYIYYIVEELEKRNMPVDLALLPIVESAYQPLARSPSSAAGIWQFIPSTGRFYGLKQNWWYDGRRDIIAATDAALTYLEKLHQDFNGDWLLALAAYNAGEYGIARAIERNSQAGKPTDFWSLQLKKETREYVPSLIAVAEIVANPARYNISLKPIANEPYFAIIDIGSQIDLTTVSDMTGMTLDELYILNPGINKWATDPDGPHHLLIPLDRAELFEKKLALLPADQRIKWQVHNIKQGDSLGKIAMQYQTDINTIKRANKLSTNLIRAGHTLVIPSPRQPSGPDTRNTYNTLQEPQLSTQGQHTFHTVRQGDTLWNISREHGVTIDQLCTMNNIAKTSVLKPGKKLLVNNLQAAELVPVVAHGLKTEQKHLAYTVKHGDSLWQISRQFNVTVKQLQKWNGLNNSSALQPGQKLDIYIGQPPADV